MCQNIHFTENAQQSSSDRVLIYSYMQNTWSYAYTHMCFCRAFLSHN